MIYKGLVSLLLLGEAIPFVLGLLLLTKVIVSSNFIITMLFVISSGALLVYAMGIVFLRSMKNIDYMEK